MQLHLRTLITALTCTAALAAVGTAQAAAPAVAAPGQPSATAATARHSTHRLGGHVRRAWPEKGAHRPKRGIMRWLARQVGPRRPIPCSRRRRSPHVRCVARNGRVGATTSAKAPLSMSSSAARAGRRASHTERVPLRTSPDPQQSLDLIRSFDIPVDDPSYGRLLNWSWTYDSAVAAAAFTSVGERDQAGRLLDQLAALQRSDGSIELAFDVETGESSATFRAGAVAFAAMAFNDFDSAFGGKLYLDNARRAANFLLSLRNDEGLVRGGPDVKWVSTQHNILAMIALNGVADGLEKQHEKKLAATYRDAAARIADGIESQLVVRSGDVAHFRQGVGDETLALDTQALGVIYALSRNDKELAKQVYEYAQRNFAIDGRSIRLSNDLASYNMTYQADGPFSGFRPYLGTGTPDVLWLEGTAEMRLVSALLGESTKKLDASMKAWWDVTRKRGLAPLGADRTVTDNEYNEYHVWPTAAAGAWAVLGGQPKQISWADSHRAK